MSTAERAGLDVRDIQKQLRQLWEDLAAVKAEDGQEALVRSCVLNLLVYSSGADVAALSTGLAEVTSEHPGRVLLLLVSERPNAGMSAHVTAQCHRFGKGRQVCCEQIWIEAGLHDGGRLASAVSPLFVSDLPVVLWWREQPRLGESFRDLLEISDRIIVDSCKLNSSSGLLVELAALADQKSPGKLFSDLAWGRLSAWRRQISAFFDVAGFRPHLDRLEEVRLSAGQDQGEGLPSVRALLTLGWLASRLDWSPRRASRAGRTWSIEFAAGKRSVRTTIEIRKGDGLQKVSLLGSRGSDVFEVRRAGEHLVSEVRLEGDRTPGRLVRHEADDEFQLLARELEIMSRDRVYEQALQMAAKIISLGQN